MKINNLSRGGVYTAPEIEILDFAVENGFANSVEFAVEGASELYETDLEL